MAASDETYRRSPAGETVADRPQGPVHQHYGQRTTGRSTRRAVSVCAHGGETDWWSTLHQPASVIRLDGPTISAALLWPLLVMALGFKLYFVTLLLLRIKSELLAARLRALGLQRARAS